MAKSKSLLNRIKAILKVGEEGKVQSFLEREEKKLRRSVAGYERTIENLQFNLQTTVDSLEDKLDDARTSLSSAYEAITGEDVATNAAQDSFSSVYWGAVDAAEAEVTRIEEQIKSETETTENEIEVYEEKIAKVNSRIAVITGEEVAG